LKISKINKIVLIDYGLASPYRKLDAELNPIPGHLSETHIP